MSIWTKVRDFLTPPYRQILSEEKMNPAYMALANYGSAPQPQSMPRNYRAFIKDGYRTDSTLYKCVQYIARNGSAIPPKLYTNKTREKEIPDHPLLDRLNAPNSEMSGVFYREAVMSYLLISGNSYQYAIRAKNRPPDELWPLRPDLVQIVASSQSGIVGFRFEPAHPSQSNDYYSPSDVQHLKYWSGDDELYGLAPTEVAAILIDSNTSAHKWNCALLQNWARMPGAWVVPTPLAKNERDRLEQKLKEKMQGYRNAGAPPVLDGGLTWQSMGVPPAQMDWIEGIQYNAAAIANIFNIPPMIIGDTTATTFDNMKQAEVYSYTEAIFPDLDKLYAGWNTWLVPMYPDLKNSGAYLYYDKESVEVIQEMIQAQKSAQSERATALFGATQCTMNEARVLSGLPPLPGGDRVKMGTSLIPVELLTQPIIISFTTVGVQEDPLDPDKFAEQHAAPPASAPGPAPRLPALPPTEAQPATPKPSAPEEEEQEPGPPPQQEGEKTPAALAKAILRLREIAREEASPAREQETVSPAGQHPRTLVLWEGQGGTKRKWVDETVADRLNALLERQVTHLRWVCSDSPCKTCEQNDGETVEVGDPFPSGDELPQVHPQCRCTVIEYSTPQFGMASRRQDDLLLAGGSREPQTEQRQERRAALSQSLTSTRRRKQAERGAGDEEHAPADEEASPRTQSVMVALFPADDLAARLALPGGEPPAELHITLCVLGDASSLRAGGQEDLGAVLTDFARTAPLLSGRIAGLGQFPPSESSDGLVPLYARVQVPGLQAFRAELVARLAATGFAADRTHPQYVPHVTLDYLDPAEVPETPHGQEEEGMPGTAGGGAGGAPDRAAAPPEPDLPCFFSQVWLVVGDQRTAFPLGGALHQGQAEEYQEEREDAAAVKQAARVVRRALLRQTLSGSPSPHHPQDAPPVMEKPPAMPAGKRRTRARSEFEQFIEEMV